MRITSKGQVTIPQEIREQMGFFPNTEVDFIVKGKIVQLRKVKRTTSDSRGNRLIGKMRDRTTIRMSTDEIMDLTRGDE